jgi:PKD repeat protein
VPEPASVASWCGVANETDRYTTDDAGFVSLQSNLFNLSANSTGGSTLCYNNSTSTVSDAISVSTPGARPNKVLGFPAAVFGQNIYGGTRGENDPGLPLPDLQVHNVTGDSLWSAVNYSVVTLSTPYNFAFDDWLTQTEANSSLGRNPGPRIEVMVWFTDNLNRSWLHQDLVTLPSFVNGTSDPRQWLRDQWCQDNDTQATFDYYYANTAGNWSGMTSGDIAVNMSAVFANVEQYIATNPNGTCFAPDGTNISSYYVDEFPLGIEFYPNRRTYDETVSWSVSSWCYTFVTGTPTGNAVDCNPTTGPTVAPLTIAPTSNVTSGLQPLDVNFSATVSGGAAPFNYTWQFGKGLGTGPGLQTNYTYWQPGTYIANLTVVDFDDILTSSNLTITVEPVKNLTVTLRSSPGSGLSTGSKVEFTATVLGGRQPYGYDWWGLPSGSGCQSADTPSLNCTPSNSGTYNVTVGVKDPGGYAQASMNVTISGSGGGGGGSGGSNPGPAPILPKVAPGQAPYVLVGVIVVILALITIVALAVRARRRRGAAREPDDARRARGPGPNADPYENQDW